MIKARLSYFLPSSLIPFYKNTASSAIAQAIALVIGLGASIIMTRSLGVEGRGAVAWITSVVALAKVFNACGLNQTVKKLAAQYPSNINSYYYISIIIVILASVIILPLAYYISGNNHIAVDNSKAFLCGIFLIPIASLSTIHSDILIGLQKIKAFGLLIIFEKLIILVLVITLYFTGLINPFSGILILIASNFSRLVLTQFFFPPGIFHPKFDWKKIIRQNTKLLISNHISTIFYVINYNLLPILLGWWGSVKEVGSFAAAKTIYDTLILFSGVYTAQIVPKIASGKIRGEKSHNKKHLLLTVTFIMTAIAVFIFFSADWIIALLYGNAFHESAVCLKIMMPSVIFFTIFSSFCSFIIAEHEKYIIYPQSFLLGGNILFSLFFINNFNATEAAAVLTGGCFIAMIATVALLLRKRHS